MTNNVHTTRRKALALIGGSAVSIGMTGTAGAQQCKVCPVGDGWFRNSTTKRILVERDTGALVLSDFIVTTELKTVDKSGFFSGPEKGVEISRTEIELDPIEDPRFDRPDLSDASPVGVRLDRKIESTVSDSIFDPFPIMSEKTKTHEERTVTDIGFGESKIVELEELSPPNPFSVESRCSIQFNQIDTVIVNPGYGAEDSVIENEVNDCSPNHEIDEPTLR